MLRQLCLAYLSDFRTYYIRGQHRFPALYRTQDIVPGGSRNHIHRNKMQQAFPKQLPSSSTCFVPLPQVSDTGCGAITTFSGSPWICLNRQAVAAECSRQAMLDGGSSDLLMGRTLCGIESGS